MESQTARPAQPTAASNEPSNTEKSEPDNARDNTTAAEESTTVSKIEYPSAFKRNVVVGSLMLASFLIALDLSIIATAIPVITTEFTSMADAGWYGSAFFLTLAAFVSAWGKGYKYFSLRVVYIVAILVFEVGSLLCALAPNSIALIIGRAIQGVGGAGISGGSYTITAFICPPSLQPIVVGLLGSVFTVASIVGPLLGGVFTSKLTWRWCFYINLPIGAVTVLCMIFFFRTPVAAKANYGTPIRKVLMSFDPIGEVLIFAGLLSFFLAVQWGGVAYPWNSSVEIGLLVGCILILILFAVNEWYQGDNALVVYRLLRNRSIGASAGFILFLNAGNIALQYQLPVYFQAIQGDSPVESGLKLIPSILSTAVATALGSGLAGKLQVFQPFLLAASVIATVGCGLIFTFGLSQGIGGIIGYQILFGVGTGLGVQLPNLVATVTSAAGDVSTAVSSVAFFMLVAGGWGVAVTDAILNNLLLQKVPVYVPELNGHEVLAVGAAAIKDVYSGEALRGVRLAYLDGLHAAWALGIAAFGLTFFWALIPKWPGRLIPAQGGNGKNSNAAVMI